MTKLPGAAACAAALLCAATVQGAAPASAEIDNGWPTIKAANIKAE